MKQFQSEIQIKRPELQFESCEAYTSKPGELLPYDKAQKDTLILVNTGKFILREKNIDHLTWYNPQNLPDDPADDHIVGMDTFLTSGDAVSLQADTEYMLYSDEESSCYIITYRGVSEIRLPHKSTLREPVSIFQMIRQLQQYAKTPPYPAAMCDYTLMLICCEVLTQSVMYAEKTSVLFQNVCDWIHANATGRITVAMTAEHFGYNIDYLERTFRKDYPKGLQHYIIQERINHIKYMLLTTNLTLKEIAQRLDFSDYKLFLKFFTYHVSLSPTQFRKIFTENQTFHPVR